MHILRPSQPRLQGSPVRSTQCISTQAVALATTSSSQVVQAAILCPASGAKCPRLEPATEEAGSGAAPQADEDPYVPGSEIATKKQYIYIYMGEFRKYRQTKLIARWAGKIWVWRPFPARLGPARPQLSSARLGSARPGPARIGSARLGSAWLGSAQPGPARLGSSRAGSARLGSALLCHWPRPVPKRSQNCKIHSKNCCFCKKIA